MTDTAPRPTEPHPGPCPELVTPERPSTEARDDGRPRRGKLEVYRAPEQLSALPTADELEGIDLSAAADVFDFSKLLADHDEADVRAAIGEMLKVVATGSRTTVLFSQDHPEGMSLVHVWFGANFPLFRHSHPAYGDCLYYVVNGSIVLGSQTLGPGSGFFVPGEMPYRYTAGPEGVELLEFRAGGGVPNGPGMTLDEPSLDAVKSLTEKLQAAQPSWVVPDVIGALPLS